MGTLRNRAMRVVVIKIKHSSFVKRPRQAIVYATRRGGGKKRVFEESIFPAAMQVALLFAAAAFFAGWRLYFASAALQRLEED
jgi:hypothetical protein